MRCDLGRPASTLALRSQLANLATTFYSTRVGGGLAAPSRDGRNSWSSPVHSAHFTSVLLVGKWEGIRDMRLHPQNSIPSTPIPSRRRCRGWGPASLHIVSRPSEGCEWQSWLCQFMRLPLPSMLALSTNYRRCPCHRQYDAHGDNISTCRNHLATRTQATTTPWLAS